MIPEFIQHQARPVHIADAVWELYQNESARSSMIKGMDEIILQLAEVDAGRRAAQVVLGELDPKFRTTSDASRAGPL
jgi:lipid A disaccharide synthetase